MSDQVSGMVKMFNGLLEVQEEATVKALEMAGNLRMRIITGDNTPVKMDELVALLATLADTAKQIQNLVLADVHTLLKTMDQVAYELTMEKLVMRNFVTLLDSKGLVSKAEFEEAWKETVKQANKEVEESKTQVDHSST